MSKDGYISRRHFLESVLAGLAAAGVPSLLSARASTIPSGLTRQIVSQLDPPTQAIFQFGGVMGQRLAANQRNWLMVAPIANPAMVEMFRDRDLPGRKPSYDLLWWSGEFAGKYLISGVQGLRITRDPHLHETLQTFVDDLIRYQAPDGYLGPFELSKRMIGKDRVNNLLWDLWGQYHCMLGLYLWYRETGDGNALGACRRAADLFCRFFIDGGNQVEAAGAPAMNQSCAHIFTLLYQETGEPRYLQMLQMIERAWATAGNFVAGFQQGEAFFQSREHRWESLHAVQAVAELYFITGEERYRRAFTQIWRSIRERDRHITGGFSSLEEATGNPYDPRPIETCGTIAWMALTLDMLRMTGDCSAADELELSTWNAVLGAQHPDGRWWTYNTPMGGVPTEGMQPMGGPDSNGVWRGLPAPMNDVPWFLGERVPTQFDIGWQDRPGASYLSCCANNGPRGLGIVSEWAVMTAADGLTLNFYGPSTFVARAPSGQNVRLAQSTSYPIGGRIRLVVTPDRNEQFTLRLRIPGWSRTTRVLLNGQAQPIPKPGTYLSLNRVWRSGDIIDLTLNMSPRILVGGPPPPDSRTPGSAEGKVAIYRGPLLLAYDARFDNYDPAHLPAVDTTRAPRLLPVNSDAPGPLLLLQFATVSGGTITLCDFASAGHSSALSVSGPPDTSKVWQFRRSDGTVLAPKIRLLPNGAIADSSHPNESRWGLEGDTLVFYAQDGTPSTRFVWTAVENGRMILRGRFTFDRSITHVLSELDLQVTDKVWHFGRGDGTSLAERMRLLPNGAIAGSTHPNESRWRMEGETLVFCAANGTPTTRFEEVATEHGRVILRGRFSFDQRITHVLSELDLEVRNKIWQFWSSLNPLSLRLLPDGAIDGSIHPNETRWGFEGSTLVFYTREGLPSTRFTRTRVENGLMVLEGDFEFDRRIKHKLIEHNPDLGWVMGSPYVSWLPAL